MPQYLHDLDGIHARVDAAKLRLERLYAKRAGRAVNADGWRWCLCGREKLPDGRACSHCSLAVEHEWPRWGTLSRLAERTKNRVLARAVTDSILASLPFNPTNDSERFRHEHAVLALRAIAGLVDLTATLEVLSKEEILANEQVRQLAAARGQS